MIARTGLSTPGCGAYARPISMPRSVAGVNEPVPDADADLLRRIAEGESDALSAFYDAHASKLFGFALRILNDPTEAEDTVQEVFLQIWDKVSSYQVERGRPLAWVFTLARNRAIDRLRSAQRRARLIDATTSEHFQTAAASDGSCAAASSPADDETEMVRSALGRLPEDQRRAIELAFFHGFTQTEIATALNEPLGTVKARIRRGLVKVREDLSPFLRTETPRTVDSI